MAGIGASWIVESGPAVIKKMISKASTTPNATRFCARPGVKLDSMNDGLPSSRTTVVLFTIVFTIEASLRKRRRAVHEAHTPFCRDSPSGLRRRSSTEHYSNCGCQSTHGQLYLRRFCPFVQVRGVTNGRHSEHDSRAMIRRDFDFGRIS
jgi:hypothetical protein